MSSPEEDKDNDIKTPPEIEKQKKGVLHRACDFCRRRKIRCDGHEMPEKRCSNCINSSVNCTYVGASRMRPSAGYVETLENRLANVEKLLSMLSPHSEVPHPNSHEENALSTPMSSPPITLPSSLPLSGFSMAPIHTDVPDDDSASTDDEYQLLPSVGSRKSQQLSERENPRFFGKSSGLSFIQNVRDYKLLSDETAAEGKNVSHFLISNPRRPEFWTVPSWALSTLWPVDFNYDYPEPDLLYSLVDCYFTNVNMFYPLLHRPSFLSALAGGLHLRDDGFATTVMLVCAVGCRFSDDPRVTHIAFDTMNFPTGWKIFHQVRKLRRSRYVPRSIYDLQVLILAVLFMDHSAIPQAAWTIIGTGLRFAQDVGAHRRKMYGARPSHESELWKRAFWILVVLDRLSSSNLGRPCGIQSEDFDVGLPIECDDEYWSHPDPDQAFKQPPGKPSKITFFVSLIKLTQILAFALRSIYSIKKSNIVLGLVGSQWDQHIVADLDSAVNQWENSVSPCLRWDARRVDDVFFKQSAVLYSHYFGLQIVIHRQYMSRRNSVLSLPSMVICANAARSCCHMLDGSKKRLGLCLNQCIRNVFVCGVVLLLNLWSGQSIGRSVNSDKVLEDVGKCQGLLQECENRWVYSGRLGDFLAALRNVGDTPFYRLRHEETHRDYLFVPNFSCFGHGGSAPPTAGIGDGVNRPPQSMTLGPANSVDTTKEDPESHRSARFPSSWEELFFDTCTSSSPEHQNKNTFPINTGEELVDPATFSRMNFGPGGVVPLEVLMYNDLVGGRRAMDCNLSTQTTTADFDHDIFASRTDWRPGYIYQQMHADMGNENGPEDVWSTVTPGLGDWNDWTFYINFLSQIQNTATVRE